jgi:MipA family protein
LRKILPLGFLLALASSCAFASSDPFSGIAAEDGVAIGAGVRGERSPYRDAGTRHDFLPIYLYEGRRFYLHPTRVGLKLGPSEARRLDFFLRQRLEGHPVEDIPASLAGMAPRESGIDAGVGAQLGGAWGVLFAEAMRDVTAASKGSELRLGYKYPWRSGNLWIRPHAMIGLRGAKLNDYYFGVRPGEATATRPAYTAGSGVMPELGVYAAYRLSERWRLLAGATVTRLPREAAASPIVELRTLRSLTFALAYDVSPEHEAWPEKKPLTVRALRGASSDCKEIHILTLRCTSTHTRDDTGIWGFEVGRPFIDRLNNWPLDIAGFVGFTRHREAGLQPDFWQVKAYLKSYWYGFPWDAKLRTRLGLGLGLSYADQIPFAEARDLAARGRGTSKVLQVFDPTVDFSVGDLLRVKRLKETYLGLGVSHRSGIFGSSRVFGNVSGGSNYIYSYVETTF